MLENENISRITRVEVYIVDVVPWILPPNTSVSPTIKMFTEPKVESIEVRYFAIIIKPHHENQCQFFVSSSCCTINTCGIPGSGSIFAGKHPFFNPVFYPDEIYGINSIDRSIRVWFVSSTYHQNRWINFIIPVIYFIIISFDNGVGIRCVQPKS